MKKSGRGIQSVEIGSRLLNALVDAGEALALGDLASAAEIAPAQAHSYLLSYRKLDLVEQDSKTGLYRIGPFAMRLGMTRLHQNEILVASQKALSELSARFEVTSIMLIAVGGSPTVIHVSEGPNALPINLRQGSIWSLTGTITGLVFAAFMDKELARKTIEKELSRMSDTGNPEHDNGFDRKAFQKSVDLVAKQGYAMGSGIIPEVTAISAPILNSQGNLQLVLSVVGPEPHMESTANGRELKALMEAAQQITTRVRQLEENLKEAKNRPKRGPKSTSGNK